VREVVKGDLGQGPFHLHRDLELLLNNDFAVRRRSHRRQRRNVHVRGKEDGLRPVVAVRRAVVEVIHDARIGAIEREHLGRVVVGDHPAMRE